MKRTGRIVSLAVAFAVFYARGAGISIGSVLGFVADASINAGEDVRETEIADRLEEDGLVSRVPWFGSFASYDESFDAAEKRTVFEMARIAGDVYHDGDARASGCVAIKTDALDGFLGKDSGFSFDRDNPGQIVIDGDDSGFDASIYTMPDGTIVLAFRGTESLADVDQDRKQLTGQAAPAQYEAASRMLRLLLANNPGANIVVTGHSLGGGLVQYAMIDNDLEGRVKGYTFNSAGLANDNFVYESRARIEEAGRNLVNVRNDGDPISAVRYHIGAIYDIDNDSWGFAAHSLGRQTGADDDGTPVYNGLLGNLQRDAGGSSATGGCPCGAGCQCKECPERKQNGDPGADGGSGNGGTGDSSGGNEAGGTGEHEGSGRTDGLCPCSGSAAKRAELAEAKKLLSDARNRLFEAEVEAKGAWWKLLAVALEPFPGWMEKAGGAVAGPLGEEAIKELNRAARMYFDGGIDVKELATAVLESLKGALENTLAESDEKSSWWRWIYHPIDTISEWIDKLENVWEYGQELGEAVAGVVASRDKLDEAGKKAAFARKRLDDFLSENGDGGKGGCFCSSGCHCVHCGPPDGDSGGSGGGDGGGSGGSGGEGGGSGGSGGEGGGGSGGEDDRDIIGEWIAGAGSAGEDPWAPIRAGISRDGSVPSGSLLLPDVIGLGQFTKILDEADELAKWSEAAGAYADVAAGIWGAVTAGGDGAASTIGSIETAVVKSLASWLDAFLVSKTQRLADWLNARIDVLVEKLETILGPFQDWMGNLDRTVKRWLAENVSKWIETMKAYSRAADGERKARESMEWTFVDYGLDGPVDVDVDAGVRDERRQEYRETVSP